MKGKSITTLNRWLVLQAGLWSAVLVFAAWTITTRQPPAWSWWGVGISMALSHAGWWVVLRTGRRFADWVTLLRFVGLLVVIGLVATGRTVDWTLWSLMVGVVVFDLLDGWAARLWGGSEAGALLDMETDQFTTLGLSLVAAGLAGAGVWTLLLPGFKYAYVLALLGVGLPAHDPKPRDGDNRRGRLICAAVMVLLLASLAPPVSPPVAKACTMVAVLALAYSFSSDAAFLWRHRGDVFRPR